MIIFNGMDLIGLIILIVFFGAIVIWFLKIKICSKLADRKKEKIWKRMPVEKEVKYCENDAKACKEYYDFMQETYNGFIDGLEANKETEDENN